MKAKVEVKAMQLPRTEAITVRLDLTLDPESSRDIDQIDNLISSLDNCNAVEACNVLAKFWQSDGQL